MADTCHFGGPLVPLFWIFGGIFSGFQNQSGFCLIYFFGRGECNIHSPRSTSGATHAKLFEASQLVTSPHASAEVGFGSDSNGQSPTQKTNAPCTSDPVRIGCTSFKGDVRLVLRIVEVVFRAEGARREVVLKLHPGDDIQKERRLKCYLRHVCIYMCMHAL